MLIRICYYITVSISKNVKREHIIQILEKNEVDFLPVACPDAVAQTRKKDQCFQPFNRHCDCDTTLGIIHRRKNIVTKGKLKRIKKLYSSQEEVEKEVLRQNEAWRDLMKKERETQQWLNFLQELLTKIWRVNIIIHWQSNPFLIKRIEKIGHAEITPDLLLNIEEDVLYEFVKEKNY
ncbi:MAG: hypothetical protein ACFFD4_06835 [Candidatus Odinarchaeota archaeon]